MLESACDVCGTFYTKKKRHQRYCSPKCYKKAWPVLNREKHNARQRRKRASNLAEFREKDLQYARAHRAKLTSIHPWAYLLKSRKSEAKQKGLAFDLDHEWAASRWNKGCAITGLAFRTNEKRGPWPFSPSIDQITPGLGYTKENARFVLWGVNALKGVGTDEDMFEIAKAIMTNKPQ